MRVDLTGCARCRGEGHEGLDFQPFTHPVAVYTGQPPLTHWAICPATGEPIMLVVLDLDDHDAIDAVRG